jgi:transcriptional regulator with XRE-family HTH domain
MREWKASGRDPILVEFGLAIQKRRQEMGLSQEEAAARVGVHRTYYADIERGTRNVGLKNVVAIARGLDIKLSDLIKKIR